MKILQNRTYICHNGETTPCLLLELCRGALQQWGFAVSLWRTIYVFTKMLVVQEFHEAPLIITQLDLPQSGTGNSVWWPDMTK